MVEVSRVSERIKKEVELRFRRRKRHTGVPSEPGETWKSTKSRKRRDCRTSPTETLSEGGHVETDGGLCPGPCVFPDSTNPLCPTPGMDGF